MANRKSARDKRDDAWMRGFATATSIAARCFQADGLRILGEGGFTVEDLTTAGVEQFDIDGVLYGRDKPDPEDLRPALWRHLTGPQRNLLRHLAQRAPRGLLNGRGWAHRTAEVLIRHGLATETVDRTLYVTPAGSALVMPAKP